MCKYFTKGYLKATLIYKSKIRKQNQNIITVISCKECIHQWHLIIMNLSIFCNFAHYVVKQNVHFIRIWYAKYIMYIILRCFSTSCENLLFICNMHLWVCLYYIQLSRLCLLCVTMSRSVIDNIRVTTTNHMYNRSTTIQSSHFYDNVIPIYTFDWF